MVSSSREDNIEDAKAIYAAGVSAVRPTADDFVKLRHFAEAGGDDVFLLGLGKASLLMAGAAARAQKINGGLVTLPKGYRDTFDQEIFLDESSSIAQGIQIIEGDHPYPGDKSLGAVTTTCMWIEGLPEDASIAVLISGGGSALWGAPIAGIDNARYGSIVAELVNSGDPIGNVNLARRHLNSLAGGGLKILIGDRRVLTFVLSDVPNDDVAMVSSGPMTLPNDDEVERLNWYLSDLKSRGVINSEEAEAIHYNAVKKLDTTDGSAEVTMIGSNGMALASARQKAIELGYHCTISTSPIEGSADRFGRKIVKDLQRTGGAPGCILYGGESTVTVTGTGRGGRNQELALSAALELDRLGVDATILSAGTDGIDGPTDAAGAVVSRSTIQQGNVHGRRAADYLQNNDSYSYFEGTDGHLITGPTHTNVMDIVVVIV